jgi:hypothetical protein
MYTYAVDIWSCGCIFAEMLGRNPLFPGKNFVHQLSLVFDVIGSPKENEVTHIINIEAKKFLSSQAKKPKVSFSRIFPDSSSICWELLDNLLVFDPDKRISVDEALKSSFLKNYYIPECQSFPVISKEFEFLFERQNLTRYQLKSLIIAEVNSLKKEKGTIQSTSPPPPAGGRLERSNSNIRQRPKESSGGKKALDEENDNNSITNNSQQKGITAGDRKASYTKGTTATNNRSYSAPRMRPSGANNPSANPSNIPSSSAAVKQPSNLPSKATTHHQQQHNRNLSGISETEKDENENDGASSSIMKTINRVANEKTTSNHEKMTIDKLLSQYSNKASSEAVQQKGRREQLQEQEEEQAKKDKNENSLRSSMRLSLDDENILSKYKKYEKATGAGATGQSGGDPAMDIDRLQNLLPSQNLIQTPNKSLRLSSHQLQQSGQRMNSSGLDSNVENEIDDLLVKRFENSVLSSSQQQQHPQQQQQHQIQESLEKSRKEFVSSPIRQSSSSLMMNEPKKSILQTYTSPKRLSRNKSFQSNDDNDSQTTTDNRNGIDYERKKNFPSLSSPNDRLRQSSSSSSSMLQQSQQRQSNPHGLSLLSSQERKDNNDDEDDDEEDLKTLRAKHAEKSKSSLSRSRDEAASRREEGQRLSSILSRQSQEQLLLEQQQEERKRKETASPSVFRASWKNMPVSSITGDNNAYENNSSNNGTASQLKKSTDRTNSSLTGGLISSRIVPHSYHINKIQDNQNEEDEDDEEDDYYRNRQKSQQEKRNDNNYDNHSISSHQTRGNHSVATAATTKYNLHQPVIPPPVQHQQSQQHQNQAKETVANKNATAGGEKRKITVPKSPKFSTMSWQRRQFDYNNEEKKPTAGADGKKQRSVSVGKTRM